MGESKTLLSQNEIDALVLFLQGNKGTPIGEVLDQSSIDKLIELVKYNNRMGVYFGRSTEKLDMPAEGVLFNPDYDIASQRENCSIECEPGENGFIELFCVNSADGGRYRLTPACFENNRYIPDDSTAWGYAIEPKMFCKLANMFGVKYSTATYEFVCRNFAKVMYGNESAVIAGVYLPPECDR